MLKKFLKKFRYFRLLNYFFNNNYKKYEVFNKLSKDSVVLDIGAHIGQVTQYIDDKFGSKIYCYEPNNEIFKILKNNFSYKNNIELNNVAISDSKKNDSLYFTSTKSNLSDINESLKYSIENRKKNISNENFIKVQVITISELLNRFKKIDLIKINIEGHEYKILPEIIKNKDKINKVVCQLHGDYVNHLNDVHNDLLNDLKELDLLQKWFYEW